MVEGLRSNLVSLGGMALALVCSASACRAQDSPRETGAGADASIDAVAASVVTKAEAGGPLAGRVVDIATKRPLAGRTVRIGGMTATTDGQGQFNIENVPATYDAVVIEPDASTLSFFFGIHRRDPLLVHTPSHALPSSAYGGKMSGTLSWDGGSTASGGASVAFFSSDTDGHTSISGGAAPGSASYDLGVQWAGEPSTTGRIVALARVGEADGGSDESAKEDTATSWFASEPCTISASGTTEANLALQPVRLTRVAGTISGSAPLPVTELLRYYRLPIPDSQITVGGELTSDSTFAATLEDLSAIGVSLCVQALATGGLSDPALSIERCGVSAGETGLAMTLRPPPRFVGFDAGSTILPDSSLQWTAFTGGVHLLALEPAAPLTGPPSLYVFTEDTQVTLPDLGTVGVEFPGGTDYQATVTGYSPFASLDDALGPGGLGAIVRAETESSPPWSALQTSRTVKAWFGGYVDSPRLS